MKATLLALAVLVAILGLTGVSQATDSAKISIVTAPTTMDPGEKGDVIVDLLNTGDEDWPVDTVVRVAAVKDPEGNDVPTTGTPFFCEKTLGGVLAPGDYASDYGVKTLSIEAPAGRGVWQLEVWVQIGNLKLRDAEPLEITVKGSYEGRITLLRVALTPERGRTQTWKATARNTGEVWWDPGEVVVDCKIKRTIKGNSADGKKAFEKRYTARPNGELVSPDGDYNYESKVTAPTKAGEWELQWQLYDLEEGEYFGQKTYTTIKVK